MLLLSFFFVLFRFITITIIIITHTMDDDRKFFFPSFNSLSIFFELIFSFILICVLFFLWSYYLSLLFCMHTHIQRGQFSENVEKAIQYKCANVCVSIEFNWIYSKFNCIDKRENFLLQPFAYLPSSSTPRTVKWCVIDLINTHQTMLKNVFTFYYFDKVIGEKWW